MESIQGREELQRIVTKEKDYTMVPYSRISELIATFLTRNGVNAAHASGLIIRDSITRDENAALFTRYNEVDALCLLW